MAKTNDQVFRQARKVLGEYLRAIREHRELNPGQWCLFAPVQPGNEIKLAMFRRKACSKSTAARNLAEHRLTKPLLFRAGNRMPPCQFVER